MPTLRSGIHAQRAAAILMAVAAASFVAAMVLVVSAPGVSADYDTDCAAPTSVFDETNMPTNLNVGAADVVVISSGTFSGSVNVTPGGIICVDTAGTFAPTNLNGTIRLFVRGGATIPPSAVGSGSSLDNEGDVTFLPQINVNGLAEIINRAGATLTVDGNMALGPGVTATNDGDLTIVGDANFDGTVTNNGTITNGGLLVLTGTMINNATVTIAGQTTIDSGGALINTCRYSTNGMISDDSIVNSGVIDLLPGNFLNNGAATMTQTTTGIMLGDDFTNDGVITGAGQFQFLGLTENGGTVSGTSPDDPIVFEDETPTGSQIFDIEEGTATNVVAGVVTPPDPDACGVLPPTTTTSTSTTSTSTTSTSTTSTSTTSTTEPTTTTSTSTTSTSTTSSTTSTSTTSTSTTSTSTTSTTEPTSTTSTTEPTSTTSTSTTSTTEPTSTTSTSTAPSTTSTSGPGPAPTTSEPPDDDPTTVPAGDDDEDDDDAAATGTLPRSGSGQVGRLAAAGALFVVAGVALGAAARQARTDDP